MTRNEEILTILQEECAEVIQAVSKVRRFGAEANIAHLEVEIADLLCMINLLYDFDILKKDKEQLRKLMQAKTDKLKVYSGIFNDCNS